MYCNVCFTQHKMLSEHVPTSTESEWNDSATVSRSTKFSRHSVDRRDVRIMKLIKQTYREQNVNASESNDAFAVIDAWCLWRHQPTHLIHAWRLRRHSCTNDTLGVIHPPMTPSHHSSTIHQINEDEMPKHKPYVNSRLRRSPYPLLHSCLRRSTYPMWTRAFGDRRLKSA